MEKGRVREERQQSKSPERREITKPMSAVEEVVKEPQYVVDREKVRCVPIKAHRSRGTCLVGSLNLSPVWK